LSSPAGWPSKEFSPEVWQRTPPEFRYRLYKDLRARRVLDRKERKEVFNLLGSPDYSAPDGSYVDYVMREGRPRDGMLYAVVWLHIRFDRAGVVDEFRVSKE